MIHKTCLLAPFIYFMRAITVLIFLSFLSSCASMKRFGTAQEPYPPGRPPEVGDILHIPTGYYVTGSEMLDAAADTRIVYVGETHDNPASHRQELEILRGLANRHPGRIALGMEMFNHNQQEALDRWVAGELSENDFLKKTGWLNGWGMDFDYYKPLLNFARDKNIPVIALNADKKTVRTVAQKALPELTKKEREMLPEMDMDDPYHKSMVAAIYGGHDSGENHSDGFRRVQTLWDETMAESIAAYLSSSDGSDKHMLVVAGGHHVRFGFGIPRRVFRRLPVSYTIIGSREIVVPKEKIGQMMDVEMPLFPMPPYDYIAFTKYESLDKRKVRLGVFLKEKEKRVTVQSVISGSAAEKAGLLGNDEIISFDGKPVNENFDLIYEVMQKRPGDKAELMIRRNRKEIRLSVTFKEAVHDFH